MSVIGIHTVLDFGKYSGKKVEDVLNDDPAYLLYLRRPDKMGKMRFSMDLHCALDAMLYAVGVGPNDADQPRYPQEVVQNWLNKQQATIDQERSVARQEQERAQEQRQQAMAAGNSIYSAWGAW